MKKEQLKIGDYIARYSDVNSDVMLYIAQLIELIQEDEPPFKAKILTAFDRRFTSGRTVDPFIKCCKKISSEEVTFYMLQHGISNE